MPDGEYEDDILFLLIAVHRKVAGPPARNDEFSEVVLGKAPDQWVVLQNLDGLCDEFDGFRSARRIGLDKEVREPLEVGKTLGGVDQPRQDFALGFVADCPLARARAYACTSSAA